MTCPACDLPENLEDNKVAFLWPPHGHAVRKLTAYLGDTGHDYEHLVRDNCVRVGVPAVSRFLVGLSGLLSDAEAADTRLLLTDTDEPGLKEFGNVTSLTGMIRRLKGDWVVELIREQRFFSAVQPICHAGGANEVMGHEYLLRGHERDGSEIAPSVLFGAAEDPRVFFNLDRTARISAVRTAARHAIPGNIFVNFMPGSIYDPNVCLRTTVNAVMEVGIDPGRVVFEVVESQRIDDLTHLRGIVNFYRDAGFRIALDDFGAGHANLNTYLALRPDYVKLDKDLTGAAHADAARLDMVGDLVRHFQDADIRVIAEGIETAEDLTAMQGVGVDYVQGYHLGKPARPQAGNSAV